MGGTLIIKGLSQRFYTVLQWFEKKNKNKKNTRNYTAQKIKFPIKDFFTK